MRCFCRSSKDFFFVSRSSCILAVKSCCCRLSWKCRRHVATCRRRHNVSLQFWPDGSVSPTQNLRCRGSLCRLELTFTRILKCVCRNILWYGSTYAQIPNAHFCHVLVLSCSGGVTTHTHPTPTRIANTHNSHNE